MESTNLFVSLPMGESRLLVVNTDMPLFPIHSHTIVVGQVKPSLRHVHSNVQFSFRMLRLLTPSSQFAGITSRLLTIAMKKNQGSQSEV